MHHMILTPPAGFIAKKNADEGKEFRVGQPVETVIMSANQPARSILLAAKLSMVAQAMVRPCLIAVARRLLDLLSWRLHVSR